MAQSEELVVLLEQARPGLGEEAAASVDEEITQRRQEQRSLKTIVERAKAPALTN